MWISLGAVPQPDGSCSFELWAPRREAVELEVISASPRRVPMIRDELGTHRVALADVQPGSRYRFWSGDRSWADPASRWQPDGVHGPSCVVDPEFAWTDTRWRGRALADSVIYELHVGTFTRAGTFDAAIDELDRLVQLGIGAIEIMPVAQCPGARNWGYDGAFVYAVANAYGGPDGLRRFVDACHARELAVVLDVVYNHFGPEGAPWAELAPFFRADCHTPWGDAINFDGPDSDGVRRFFLDNAAMWLRTYHLDGLRLDAVHGIVDRAPIPFLAELAELGAAIGAQSWPRWLIAESDANDPSIVRPRAQGGLGLDAVWADDFHHCVHRLLTGERHGYYADYGERELLAAAINDGFAYRGQHSRFRRRRHGAPPDGVPPEAFVVCVQNHDQIGNRPLGERLTTLVEPAAATMAMALLLFSPHVPLLFMGEEYGETAPFLFFTDHGDEDVIAATRKGRAEEHEGEGDPPDPQSPATMAKSVIDPRRRNAEREQLVRTMIAIRRLPELIAERSNCRCELIADGRVLRIAYGERGPLGLFRIDGGSGELELPLPEGRWVIGVEHGARGGSPMREPWWFVVLHRSEPA
ncbi:MAG TPA: malto-oligosyltrehalose trehalohydrolase [Nannocystaceae bacterium]|nr:malto-oligosyltrehalose trehalohydrolase [Nannocystaceae bacterium]